MMCYFKAFTERCQSGRMEHTANVLNGKPFRGFESLPLRIDNLLVLLTRMLDAEL